MLNNEYQVNHCLAAIGARNGIKDLKLDANGDAGLKLHDGRRLYMKFMRVQNTLCLYDMVFDLPADLSREWMLTLMEKNCLEAETEGGVLSFSKNFNAFVYHIALPTDNLDTERLEQALLAFLEKKQRILRHFDLHAAAATSAMPATDRYGLLA